VKKKSDEKEGRRVPTSQSEEEERGVTDDKSGEKDIGMAIWVRVPDPMRMGTGTIFYSWISSVPEPKRDRYMPVIFFIHG
jgi:hypothetical protein